MPLPDTDPRRFNRIVVLTGAGVSVASGVPVFRGPDGLWRDDQAQRLGQASAVADAPQAMWRWFSALRQALAQARPSPAHRALALFEAGLRPARDFLLLTQNVDSLHQDAGSQRVVELHGNLRHTRCSAPACRLPPFADDRLYPDGPPPCPACGGQLRPDVVLSGEALPVDGLWQAQRALRECGLFVAIGSSATVGPAAGFVQTAREAGARTLWLNADPPPANQASAWDEVAMGDVQEVLPRWLT